MKKMMKKISNNIGNGLNFFAEMYFFVLWFVVTIYVLIFLGISKLIEFLNLSIQIKGGSVVAWMFVCFLVILTILTPGTIAGFFNSEKNNP